MWDSSLATCPGLCSVFSTFESSPMFIAPEFPVSLVKVTHTLCMPVLPLWLLQPEQGLDPGAVLRYISCQGDAKLHFTADEATMSHGISETEHCGYFNTGHQEGEVDTIYLKGWDLRTKESLSL